MAEFMEVNDGMIVVPFTIVKDDEGIETKISGFDQRKFKDVISGRSALSKNPDHSIDE